MGEDRIEGGVLTLHGEGVPATQCLCSQGFGRSGHCSFRALAQPALQSEVGRLQAWQVPFITCLSV